jgi:phenylpyruvate tautomerase PptA (4-oxalocrotonate tautomerase family)
MPLVRIDLVEGSSEEFRQTVGDVVYKAMIDILKAPIDDRFQIITQHAPEDHIADANYLGIKRSKACIFIQMFLLAGRTVEQKRRFYKAVADGLQARLGHRPEDVFIGLVEVARENWSFGNGETQYANASSCLTNQGAVP